MNKEVNWNLVWGTYSITFRIFWKSGKNEEIFENCRSSRLGNRPEYHLNIMSKRYLPFHEPGATTRCLDSFYGVQMTQTRNKVSAYHYLSEHLWWEVHCGDTRTVQVGKKK